MLAHRHRPGATGLEVDPIEHRIERVRRARVEQLASPKLLHQSRREAGRCHDHRRAVRDGVEEHARIGRESRAQGEDHHVGGGKVVVELIVRQVADPHRRRTTPSLDCQGVSSPDRPDDEKVEVVPRGKGLKDHL